MKTLILVLALTTAAVHAEANVQKGSAMTANQKPWVNPSDISFQEPKAACPFMKKDGLFNKEQNDYASLFPNTTIKSVPALSTDVVR